jgi:hypothetical protein
MFVVVSAGIVALIVIAAALGISLVRTDLRPSSRTRQPRPRIFPSWCCPLRTSRAIQSQDYFGDGITENLTTDLSRIRNMLESKEPSGSAKRSGSTLADPMDWINPVPKAFESGGLKTRTPCTDEGTNPGSPPL